MTVKEDKDKAILKDEITQYAKNLSLQYKKDSISLELRGQPDTYVENCLRTYSSDPVDYKTQITNFLVMMFALMFVPALNLWNDLSRMDGRMSEMGIRKAFGARRKTLLSQILGKTSSHSCRSAAGVAHVVRHHGSRKRLDSTNL